MAFGAAVATIYDFSAADTILALDADFLGPGPGQVRYAADFAAARRGNPPAVQRLYVTESSPTLTGARADRRFILRPHEIPEFAHAVAAALAVTGAGGETAFSVPPVLIETAPGPGVLRVAGASPSLRAAWGIAADVPVVVTRPDDDDVGDRTVGRPQLAAVEHVAALGRGGGRAQAGGGRAAVGGPRPGRGPPPRGVGRERGGAVAARALHAGRPHSAGAEGAQRA